jgi:hypothetical protein
MSVRGLGERLCSGPQAGYARALCPNWSHLLASQLVQPLVPAAVRSNHIESGIPTLNTLELTLGQMGGAAAA